MKSKNTNKDETQICRHINKYELFISINNGSDSKELDQMIHLAFKSKDEFEKAILQLKRSIKNSENYDIDILSYHIKVKYTINNNNNSLFLSAINDDYNYDLKDVKVLKEINVINSINAIDSDTKLNLSQLLISKSFVFDRVELFVKIDLNFEGLTKYIKMYDYQNKSYTRIISNQKTREENIHDLKLHEIVKEAIHNHLLTCTEAIKTIEQNKLNSTSKSEKEVKL